jgi:hypothetical protein
MPPPSDTIRTSPLPEAMPASATFLQLPSARISAKELTLWTSLLILANGVAGLNLNGFGVDLGAGGPLNFLFGNGFVAVAWGAAFWLLIKAPRQAASAIDVAVALGLCLLGGLVQIKALPVAITGLGLWLFLKRDDQFRAAGAVFLAIASQQFWGHLILSALGPELVRVDAALVGEAMVHTVKGSTWHDNVITAPSGYSIVVLERCSSFANVSTALLAWTAFSRLERARWLKRDLFVGAAIVISQIVLNVARMYLMAQSNQYYLYWHDEGGRQIYAAAASAAAVLISVVGTHWAGRTTEVGSSGEFGDPGRSIAKSEVG